MNTTQKGDMFEAYVKEWFGRTKPHYRPMPRENRGILKRGNKKRQADLEFRRLTSLFGLTLGHRMPVIVECKYVGKGRTLDVKAAAYQVNTAATHFRSAETVIVTNAVVRNRDQLERKHDVKIYDRDRLLMGNQMTQTKYLGKTLDQQIKILEQDIRGMVYEKAA